MPDLVVHAGFPKCATTALQQVLFRNDAALSQSLGRTWIGRGITPNGPGAPVAEIMYDADETKRRIADMPLKAGNAYLISSEALAHRPEMIAALADRFAISRIILTTRLPCLMALSDYCFSGWLARAPSRAGLLNRTEGLAKTCERLSQFAPLTLCPIEPEHLGRRFLSVVSPTIPDTIEEDMAQLGTANPSAPPALAAALHSVLQSKLTKPVPGPLRSAFTRMAMINRGRPEFRAALPSAIHAVFQDKPACAAEIEAYGDLLAAYGVAKDLRDQASAICRAKLAELSRKPLVNADLASAMTDHAEWFVKRIQKDRPETAALFA